MKPPKKSREAIINAQLKNLFLDLLKDTSVKGVDAQIGAAIRGVTQNYQVYTVTKKLQELYKSVGIEVPNVIEHSKLKTLTGRAMKLLPNEPRVNKTIAMTEHIVEIAEIKSYLLSMVDTLKEMSEGDAIEYIKNYLNENVKMFHKLIHHESDLQSRQGMTWTELESELVDPTKIGIVL